MTCTFPIFATPRHARSRATSSGFTLMELLIVISIIVILMLIAIPTANTIRKHTNEVSAQKSLQTIEQAQSMYATNYPVNGFACTLQALAGEPTAGPPSAPHPPSSSTGSSPPASRTATSSISRNCTKVTVNNTDRVTGYTLTAVPATPGKTGDRGFCVESGGPIKMDPAGGTNCTQMVQ